MRKIFLRATIAAAAILPVFFFISAVIESHNHPELCTQLLVYSALSPFAAFGFYFLVLWILEGRPRPKTRLKA